MAYTWPTSFTDISIAITKQGGGAEVFRMFEPFEQPLWVAILLFVFAQAALMIVLQHGMMYEEWNLSLGDLDEDPRDRPQLTWRGVGNVLYHAWAIMLGGEEYNNWRATRNDSTALCPMRHTFKRKPTQIRSLRHRLLAAACCPPRPLVLRPCSLGCIHGKYGGLLHTTQLQAARPRHED
mmetsp:Transcript_59616/g.177114  ORF Transcript_59616/g.177114 Transcript_59616/m.177114 type:complete len:180 (-) Transcript_59616:1063-1602(-)